MLTVAAAALCADTMSRRALFSSVALSTASRRANAFDFEDRRFLDNYLRSSNIYAINTDSSAKALPSTTRMSADVFVRALSKQRAIFLGEHHPEFRDHLLQAALLRRLHATGKPLAVGLEAVQRQFQPVLDDYISGRITEQELFVATEWATRWYWPFEGYAPIFRIAREYGVRLVALDMDSEDKAKVELGGLASLDNAKLREYVPDIAGFERFGSTRAFDEYIAYTLRPPYDLQKKLGQKMTSSTSVERTMTFANFLARQSLRDETMAAASVAWLSQNPDGLMMGLTGTNHAKFACGVQARTARMLPGGLDVVSSILLNPTPFNSFNGALNNLRQCDRTAVRNEACVRNDIEIQNYVLQLEYASQGRATKERDVDEAVFATQAKKGSSVLPLADYIIFS